jgi:hypothetical protein
VLEKLYEELTEEMTRASNRPTVISILAIYYFLNPFLYLYSISLDKQFLNFGVHDWRFAFLYCIGAPLLGYLLWTLRVRTHMALYAFLIFEVIRGARNGIWSVALAGIAILLYALREPIRERFSSHAREIHRGQAGRP